jgi:hypothetical protein
VLDVKSLFINLEEHFTGFGFLLYEEARREIPGNKSTKNLHPIVNV